jgi:heterotetrameric sarcosine oxidase gamma subunit
MHKPAFAPFITRLSADADATVLIDEVTGLSVATVVARASQRAAVSEYIQDRWKLAPPPGPSRVTQAGRTFIGVAPHTWLYLGEPGHRASWSDLAEALVGLAVVADQSGAYGILTVSGPDARTFLQSALFIDLHPTALGADAALMSVIAHTDVTLWQSDPQDAFTMAIPRSYALCFAQWLQTAAVAAGLRLGRGRQAMSLMMQPWPCRSPAGAPR